MIGREVVERGLQCRLDLLNRQRLADHTGGKRQHDSLVNVGQRRQRGAGATGVGQPLRPGAGVGVTGVGQQVAHRTVHAFAGDQYRRGTERVGGGHSSHSRTFGAAHHHHVLAARALDAGGGDAQLEAGNRMQCR